MISKKFYVRNELGKHSYWITKTLWNIRYIILACIRIPYFCAAMSKDSLEEGDVDLARKRGQRALLINFVALFFALIGCALIIYVSRTKNFDWCSWQRPLLFNTMFIVITIFQNLLCFEYIIFFICILFAMECWSLLFLSSWDELMYELPWLTLIDINAFRSSSYQCG